MRDRAIPMVVLATAHPAKFPDAVEAACGDAAAAARLARRPASAAGARHHAARGSGGGRKLYSLHAAAPREKEPLHECRSHASAIGPGRRHRRDAAPRKRLAGRLGRRRQPRRAAGRARHLAPPRAHGLQGHARGAPRARSPRRSRRSAAISMPPPRSRPPPIMRACCKADVPLALDVLSDILADPAFDPEELQREQNVIVQEIGAAEDTPDDLVFDWLQEAAFPGQPIGRSILGTRETVRSFDRAGSPPISRATIAAPTWWSSRPARSITRRWSPRSSGGLRASPVRRRRAASRRASSAAPGSRRASSSRCTSRSRCRAVPQRDPELLQPAGLHQRARRRHVVAPVPGGAREARALLRDLRLPLRLTPTAACSASMPAPMRTMWPS